MLAAAGCGGDSGRTDTDDAPDPAAATAFADGFVRDLVGGRWADISADVSPEATTAVRSFQRQLRTDKVARVVGKGVPRSDCPPNPAADAGNDCLAYRLAGRRVEPVSGKVTRIDGRLLLWVDREDGDWEVTTFSYDAGVSGG